MEVGVPFFLSKSFLLHGSRQVCYTQGRTMHEEMGKSEDVLTNVQSDKIRNGGENAQHRCVSPFWVIFWCTIALVSITLWMLRLLGIVELV